MREFIRQHGVSMVMLGLSLLVQGTILYVAIVQKVDNIVTDQNRILIENNIEHQRLWNAMGKPEMWRYIVPMREDYSQGLRKVNP